MMSTKLVTLDLLKKKYLEFWNKGYDVIFSFHYVKNKIFYPVTQMILQMWSRDQNLLILWETLRKKCPYLELFSPNAGKCGTE